LVEILLASIVLNLELSDVIVWEDKSLFIS